MVINKLNIHRLLITLTLFSILFVLNILNSSCGSSGCDCSKTKIIISYTGFNDPWVPAGCNVGNLPCYSFRYVDWSFGFSTGNTNRSAIFSNPDNEMPCNLPIEGCFLTESETNFNIIRVSNCVDVDGSRTNEIIYCSDSFVVTPPQCGKTKVVNRGKLNCVCG